MNSSLENFFNLFLVLGAVQGFVFCCIVFFSKARKEKSLQYLTLCVLMISLSNIQTWGIKPLLARNGFLHYFYYPWHFLIGVQVYSFLTHYLGINSKTRLLPRAINLLFLVVVTVRIVLYYTYQFKQTENLTWIFRKYTIYYEELVSLVFSSGCFLYAYYLFVTKREVYKKALRYDNLIWLKKFLRLGAFNYILWAVALFMTVVVSNYQFKYWYYPLKLFSAILIYWLGYEAYNQIKLIQERKEIRQLNSQTKEFQKSKKTPAEVLERELKKFKEIEVYILKEKRFTDPKLSLEGLSEELGMGVTTLSQLINKCAKKSFPDYINYLRVEEIKKMLLNSDYQNYTVLAIGLEAGFNSKSTFYAAFKKQVGCTPVTYQKNKL